jgi:bifunctional non-homologous end joining protein LigD
VNLRLPDPMVSRPGALPLGPSYAFEIKWDGFRAIVSTIDGLRVRSRRGWNMTERVPELAEGLVLDGELVSLDDDGLPSFARLSARVLHGHGEFAVAYVIFDVLVHARRSTMGLPYSERREILDGLDLRGPAWCTAETFDDGQTLFAAVVDQGLEGIVAKPRTSTYRPGEPGWLKIKNRSYWRFGQELELAQSRRRRRVTI